MRLHALLAATVCLSLATVAVGQQQRLSVGDQAPGLDIESWVKGEETTLETGNVYVVEFWATWCVPCRRSIPHLTELQEHFADEGLTIIGVSKEEAGVVQPFVQSQGDRMDYTVAVDRRGSTSRAWMEAAGQNGIPCAFVVDQKGKIAFIGNPLGEDFTDVLERVLGGRYDPALERSAAPALQSARDNRRLRNWQVAEMQYRSVVEMSPEIFAEVAVELFEMYLVDMGDRNRAYTFARNDLIEDVFSNDAGAQEMLIQSILLNQDIEDRHRDYDVAMSAARRYAMLRGQEDPRSLAQLALVHYHRGELVQAVELQRRAYFVARPKYKAEYRQVLDAYNEALSRVSSRR